MREIKEEKRRKWSLGHVPKLQTDAIFNQNCQPEPKWLWLVQMRCAFVLSTVCEDCLGLCSLSNTACVSRSHTVTRNFPSYALHKKFFNSLSHSLLYKVLWDVLGSLTESRQSALITQIHKTMRKVQLISLINVKTRLLSKISTSRPEAFYGNRLIHPVFGGFWSYGMNKAWQSRIKTHLLFSHRQLTCWRFM